MARRRHTLDLGQRLLCLFAWRNSLVPVHRLNLLSEAFQRLPGLSGCGPDAAAMHGQIRFASHPFKPGPPRGVQFDDDPALLLKSIFPAPGFRWTVRWEHL